MAPKKKMSGGKKKTKPVKVQIPRTLSTRIDAQAMAYARLLNDPCNAPLCHPVYAGSDGGMIVRAESTMTIGGGAGETAAVFSWTPGGIGATSTTYASSIVTAGGATAGTGITLSQPDVGYQPGFTFLNGSAAEVRVVAACIQLFFPGTESNRSGILAYGNQIGGALTNNQAVNAQGASTMFEHFGRVPVDHVEVKLRPTNFDQNYTTPGTQTPQQELARRAALGFAVTGLPAATGLTVRLVAVYEYTPKYALGLTANVASRNTSNNSLDQVINFLDQTGDWVVRGSMAAARIAGAVAGAAPYVRAISYAGTRTAQALLG